MKSSLSIWRYVVSVKSKVKISSIFVAFLEKTNFTCDSLENKQYSNGRILDLDFSSDFCYKIICINFHCYNKRTAKYLCSL